MVVALREPAHDQPPIERLELCLFRSADLIEQTRTARLRREVAIKDPELAHPHEAISQRRLYATPGFARPDT